MHHPDVTVRLVAAWAEHLAAAVLDTTGCPGELAKGNLHKEDDMVPVWHLAFRKDSLPEP